MLVKAEQCLDRRQEAEEIKGHLLLSPIREKRETWSRVLILNLASKTCLHVDWGLNLRHDTVLAENFGELADSSRVPF